jgi:hypothetical protein
VDELTADFFFLFRPPLSKELWFSGNVEDLTFKDVSIIVFLVKTDFLNFFFFFFFFFQNKSSGQALSASKKKNKIVS